MKNNKKWFRSPVFTVAAFALAVVLLLFTGVNSARAALTYFSEVYSTRVQMDNIGVSLLENGTVVSHRNYVPNSNGKWNEDIPGALLANMTGKDEQTGEPNKLVLNQSYPEKLAVQNTGTSGDDFDPINEFVRVSVYKYWLDKDGKKKTDLSPDWIKLTLKGKDLYDDSIKEYGDWVKDTTREKSESGERIVLYYTNLLKAGKISGDFADAIQINNLVAKSVTQTTKDNVITTVYDYDGVSFCLEAKVDAVQEHNAEDAALSAWGREVKINGDKLSLPD